MSKRRIGLDCRGEDFLLAEVSEGQGRTGVVGLETAGRPISERIAANGDELTIGVTVSDCAGSVKTVRIDDDHGLDGDELVRFELSRSLLEPEREFALGVEPTGEDGRYLGVVVRRKRLEEIGRACGLTAPAEGVTVRYVLRSVALGKGYLGFCRPGDGDLLALVDLTDSAASICLTYKRRIIDVASIVVSEHGREDPTWAHRFGVDLKTVISFRLANLLTSGISVPLSRLFLWGEGVDEELREKMRTLFSVAVEEPVIEPAYLDNTITVDGPDAVRFLAALGLTVN